MTQSATKNIFTQPLPPLQAPQPESQKPEKAVARTALVISITIFFAGILYLASLGFLDNSEEFRRSIGIAGLVFLLTGSFGLIINAGFLKEKYFARISLLIGCIQFALMIAAFTTNGAIPVLGSIAFLTILLIGNYFFSGPRATLFVLLSLFSGLAVILAGVFSPFAQSNSLIFTLFWSGILIAEAVIFTRFIITGQIARLLRMKIFFISITISLVPLLAMSGFAFSFQQNLLEEKSKNYVELAANNEAEKINAFIDSNLKNLNQQSTLTIFGDFLELPISKRNGSPQLEELADTIETLSQSSEQKFLKSYGVIDANGLVVYDSYSPVTGAFEADQDYFRISYQLGEAYISSINFLLYPLDSSEIIFSAPIKNKSEEIIGVIRMRYSADVFKSLLQTSAMEFGDQSFPLLIDEFGIRVVDNLHPDANYRPIKPLSSFMLSKLQHENRIPVSYRPEDPFFNRVIEQVIDDYKTSPYFSADVNPDQNTNKEIGYVIRLDNVPWYLVYVLDETFASQQLAQQANNMTLVISIFIALAGLLSLGIARYISAP
ncbi:MAG: cache domain-containing protein, partial [Anaerolineaceae bacterium]|nr:cache domain-containing protein [Anaerolineaceae bacterium]